jgi:hypothetical protein
MDNADRLTSIRSELRFELGLLHDRVNALLAAEAFLTIAYTAAMSNAAPWGASFSAVVSPILSVLGLLLALLAWPGVASTVTLVLAWTEDQTELLTRDGSLSSGPSGLPTSRADVRRVRSTQWRSMLFFRVVPGLFALVWAALTVVALVLTR